jgi:hypothetical protein
MDTTTGTSLDPIVIWCTAFVAIAGGAALLWKFLGGIRRIIKRVDEFIDDWNGTEERPGHPARPGVMARLEWIEHELKPNSGKSLRDSVDRIERELRSESNTDS